MLINTYDTVLLIFEFLLYTFHITFTVFLFCDKSKQFAGAFFNIVRTILFADILFLIWNVINRFPRFGLWPDFYKYNGWSSAVVFFVCNYLAFMQFIGQTFLAINRFTALWIPMLHTKIWTKRWYIFLIIILPLTPILPQLPLKAQLIYYPDGTIGARYLPDPVLQKALFITNWVFCSTTILGIVINVLAAYKFYKFKTVNSVNEKNKETHLFYMSCILFIYQCCRCFYNYSKIWFINDKEIYALLGQILPYFSDAYAALGSFSLLIMSASTRKAYVKFWTFNQILLKGSKITKVHQISKQYITKITRVH